MKFIPMLLLVCSLALQARAADTHWSALSAEQQSLLAPPER